MRAHPKNALQSITSCVEKLQRIQILTIMNEIAIATEIFRYQMNILNNMFNTNAITNCVFDMLKNNEASSKFYFDDLGVSSARVNSQIADPCNIETESKKMIKELQDTLILEEENYCELCVTLRGSLWRVTPDQILNKATGLDFVNYIWGLSISFKQILRHIWTILLLQLIE